ncbi:MAG: tripartite tricarboxylate transporter substrate binding protein [Reyranellaceae bacterium]
MIRRASFLRGAVATVVAAQAWPRAMAQAWPSRPLRLVVTFAPGGGADFVGRSIAPPLGEALGQTLVVENKAGANGVVGADVVAKAAPDGYTLLLGAAGTLAVAPHLGEPLPFDPLRDFIPVSLVATGSFVVAVNPGLPVQSIADLIAYAKANPDKVNFGSSGTGGAPQLATELFASMAGVRMTHVPYRGLGPAVADLMAGQIQLLFADVPLVAGHVRSGALRGLAVSGDSRSPVLPDLPTVAQAGLPGYSAGTWYGLLVPAHTPGAIVERLSLALKQVLAAPGLREALAAQGAEAAWTTPEAFAAFLRADSQKWGQLIAATGIKAK